MHEEDQGAKILIVDDEELNLKFLETFLSRKGFVTETAGSGEEAFEALEVEMPDILLLDAMMPDIDGFEVCQRLRMEEKTKSLPIIMVTALSNIKDEVRAFESGADDYVTKPVNDLELLARIRSLLRIKRLHDELRKKQAELEIKNKGLAELEQLKESLTQMIVHDLKNPLTGIMSCAELLTMTQEDLSENHKIIVTKIEESASLMLKMISDLLDVSMLEENKMKLKREKFDIRQLVNANISDISALAQRLDVKLEVNDMADLPEVHADKDLFYRIISNLLNNSLKHSNRKGTIQVGFQKQENELAVFVQDNGEGIPEPFLEKIFDKFVQADLKKRGLKTDRGLGLTFCKMAVEAHNGRIWAESTIGEGSKFTFTIPL